MPVGAIRDGKMQQKINEYNRQMGGASIPVSHYTVMLTGIFVMV